MEEQEVNPDYLKCFNDGYLLAQHEPDLAAQLSRSTGDTPHLSGLKQGIDQYNMEKSKENYPSWLKKDRLSSLDKEHDRDKEDPERE